MLAFLTPILGAFQLIPKKLLLVGAAIGAGLLFLSLMQKKAEKIGEMAAKLEAADDARKAQKRREKINANVARSSDSDLDDRLRKYQRPSSPKQ